MTPAGASTSLPSRINGMTTQVLYLQPLIQPKRFDISPPVLGDAQKVLVRSYFFLNTHSATVLLWATYIAQFAKYVVRPPRIGSVGNLETL